MRVARNIFLAMTIFVATVAGASLLLGVVAGWRHPVIDDLESPNEVEGWTRSGLMLSGGRLVSLEGVSSLPDESQLLAEMIKRGVEVEQETGRVFALIPIWHWCGNDPVGRHIARVDVAQVLRFVFQEADSGKAGGDCAQVSKYGWDVSCWYAYEQWLSNAK
jgi:hypothetical protein